MNMPTRFPYLPVASGRGDAALLPLLPLELRFHSGPFVAAHGLIDSGATVNVLPYSIGITLGAEWDAQTTLVTLTGSFGNQEARALLAEAKIAVFPPVRLVFAWSKSDQVPLLLGQVNFFDVFDISFHRSARIFEIEYPRG